MKKITFVVMAIFLSLTFYPGQSNATTTKKDAPATAVVLNPVDAAKVKVLELRLVEIKELDKGKLDGDHPAGRGTDHFFEEGGLQLAGSANA